MDDVEAIVRPRIAVGPTDRTHRCAQGEAAHPAHAIDANTHGLLL
jgi:hypothetical protein